jgi:hypothetical protein
MKVQFTMFKDRNGFVDLGGNTWLKEEAFVAMFNEKNFGRVIESLKTKIILETNVPKNVARKMLQVNDYSLGMG